jgi:hypothetical protein
MRLMALLWVRGRILGLTTCIIVANYLTRRSKVGRKELDWEGAWIS